MMITDIIIAATVFLCKRTVFFFRILNVGYLSGWASSWKLFMPAQLGACFGRPGNGFVSSCAITSLVYPITPTTSQGNGIEQTGATKNRYRTVRQVVENS